jgi:chemotaxis protein CheD
MQKASKTIHIVQGEHRISDMPDVVITTVLGSCVAACIYDPVRGVGGMNHFLLPESKEKIGDIRYAAAAMEILINGLLKSGAQRQRMEAKLFGGARMIPSLPDIGRKNAEIAQKILMTDGIRVTTGHLCGQNARRIRFWPVSGKVQMLLLGDEEPKIAETPNTIRSGESELF